MICSKANSKLYIGYKSPESRLLIAFEKLGFLYNNDLFSKLYYDNLMFHNDKKLIKSLIFKIELACEKVIRFEPFKNHMVFIHLSKWQT